MESNIQSELNKKISQTPMSYYKNVKMTPFGGSWFNLGDSQVQTIIEIPQGCYNLWKCILNFQIETIGAIAWGANIHVVQPSYYFPWLTGLQFYTAQTNNYLVDIPSYLDQYTKLWGLIQIPHDQRALEEGFCFNSYRNACGNAITANIATQKADNYVDEAAKIYVPSTMHDCSYYLTGVANDNLFSNFIAATNVANTTCQTYKIRLGDLIKDSIFDINKD